MMLCSCIKCTDARMEEAKTAREPLSLLIPGLFVPGWSYGCHICGNKRCPHHSDHTLACTNSNEPGQQGSFYKRVT